MKSEIKSDDLIFNFFKQICDEKDDVKCVELGKKIGFKQWKQT